MSENLLLLSTSMLLKISHSLTVHKFYKSFVFQRQQQQQQQQSFFMLNFHFTILTGPRIASASLGGPVHQNLITNNFLFLHSKCLILFGYNRWERILSNSSLSVPDV